MKRVKYIGNFKNNRPEGLGTIYLSNGDKCSTTWYLGDMKGEGVYTWKQDGSSMSVTCD